jgi:hypothetical protein
LSSEKGCYSGGEFGIGAGYNCLVLRYDGGPGVVELKIPSYRLKDFQWMRTIEASGNPIPFQRTSQDSNYFTIRIDLPSDDKIELKGGDHFPLWLDYLGNASMFTGLVIICTFFLFIPSYHIFQYVKRKFGG